MEAEAELRRVRFLLPVRDDTEAGNAAFAYLRALVEAGIKPLCFGNQGADLGRGSRWKKYRRYFTGVLSDNFVNLVLADVRDRTFAFDGEKNMSLSVFAGMWTEEARNVAIVVCPLDKMNGSADAFAASVKALARYDRVFCTTPQDCTIISSYVRYVRDVWLTPATPEALSLGLAEYLR